MTTPNEGDLKVWWIPQIPMKQFEVPVSSPEDAKRILGILADYDMFQFENNVKGDYSNMGGLQVFEDGQWRDWYSDDDESIDEWEPEAKE